MDAGVVGNKEGLSPRRLVGRAILASSRLAATIDMAPWSRLEAASAPETRLTAGLEGTAAEQQADCWTTTVCWTDGRPVVAHIQ